MKLLQYLSILILSSVVAFATVHFSAPKTESAVAPVKETRWEQIKKRGTLRCGYVIWPPFHIKDPNTGEMTGAIPDITNAIAKQMNLKVEWTGEVDIAHMFAGYNKYDLICGPITMNGSRARETDFAMPFGYAGYYAFTREDENRFGDDLTRINKDDVKISTMDGEYSSIIVNEDFPKAQKVPVGQLANGTQALFQVFAGKADIAITDLFSGQGFMENNPDKIKLVSEKPIRVLDFAFALPHDQMALKSALNATITNLQETGALDKIFSKYEKGVAHVLRLSKGFRHREEQ